MPTAAAERYSIKDIFRQEYGSINDENLRSAAASNPSIVCQLLDSNELSPQAMGAAAEALGSTQEVEHVERLLRLLSHENAFAREGAVKGLGAMLYHGVEVDQILESLKSHSDTSPAVREAVEEAIELAE